MTATVIRRNASVPSLYGASSTLFCLYRRYKITPASNMAATEKAKERNGLCCTNSLNSGLKRSEDDRSPPISFGEFDRSPFNARNIMSKRARINADPLQHSYGNARSSTSTAGHSAAEEDGDGDKERPAASDSVTHESEIQDKIDNHVADSQPIEEIMEIRDGVETNGMDDEDDDCDDVSEISGLSDLGVEGRWSSSAGMIAWVHSEIAQGTDLRVVLGSLVPDGTEIPEDLDDRTLWQLIISIITEPPRRKKLKDVATLETVVQLIRSCKKIVVLTGAGVSVSCGIPDFRSRDGIYARLAVDYPDLPDPQAMFDIQYFKKNPRPFFKFAKEIYPGQFNPSLSHRFIGHLESSKQLLRNYTQNIDTLESAAGITRVVQCHGSFAGATCMICKHKVDAEAIRDDIMNQVIPRCPRCGAEEELAILKPDIVFFGESLSEEFHRQIELDKDECDLLIVIGSSLKVRPVAIIPNIISADVPQVLINREPLRHLSFDVELLGDCDVIVNELCHLLGDGFKSLCTTKERSAELKREELHLPGPSCPAANAQKPDDTLDVLRSPGPVVPKDEGCAGAEKTDGCTSTDGQNVAAADESTTAGDVDHHHKNAPLSIKLSSYLKENSYLYRPPRQYIFCGAEVYEEDDDSFGDTDSSSSSSAQEEDDSPKDQSIEYTQDDRLGESETTGMDHESSGDSKVAKTAATEEEEGQRG